MRARLGMVVVAAIVAGGVAAGRAETGTVITKDGRTLRGEITQEGDQVRVSRGGILIVLSKDEVKEIRTQASAAEEYERRSAKLPRDDLAGHLKLALWCRDEGLLGRAVERCEHVLALAPDHTNAKLLLKALTKRMRSKPDRKRTPKAGKTTRKWRKGELLTREQINRIRMAEFEPGERVTVRFKNDVLNRFLEAVAGKKGYDERGDRADFLAQSKTDKLAEIVEVTGMYFADDIEIRTDPKSLLVFRRDIMPIIRANCATLKCHGGGAAKIRLYSQNTPAAVYTNFYTLDRFEKSVPGRGKVKMFDRGYPEDGLFTHYLLPKGLADPVLAHPGDIDPAVRSKDDRRYQTAVRWIKEVLERPRVDPGIDSPPEKKDRTPQPKSERPDSPDSKPKQRSKE